MTLIEIIAALFGFLCVWLTIKQNIWCWPTGILQVILYIYIFYQTRLYADMILQVIFVPVSIYGWYHWVKGTNGSHGLPVTRTGKEFGWWILVSIAGSIVVGLLMKTYTDASLPYPDSFILIASLIAQWLMARKKLESWIFWITIDAVAIAVYLAKNLYFTAILYFAFLIMAIMGFISWRKALSLSKSENLSL